MSLLRFILILVLSLTILSSMSGCVEEHPTISEEGRSVELTIEFGTASPPIAPGNRTVWHRDNSTGAWTTDSAPTASGATVWVFSALNVTNVTVYGLLETAAALAGFTTESHEERYGRFVDAIAGVENGDEDRYWQYWHNGEYGAVAADRCIVHHGDTVRWWYRSDPFA